MNIYTKIEYYKRAKYVDVYIYYSRQGARFRTSTDVRISPKHLTAAGTISVSHPGFHEDLKKISAVQARVESLITRYVEEYRVKPPVRWLEEAFAKDNGATIQFPISAHIPPPATPGETRVSPTQVLSPIGHSSSTKAPRANPAAANDAQQEIKGSGYIERLSLSNNSSRQTTSKPQLQAIETLPSASLLNRELLSFWEPFIQEKIEITRSQKNIGRINNARHTIISFQKLHREVYLLADLSQQFFNDLVFYMVKEHQHYKTRGKGKIPKGMLPTIGLSNDTAIKRMKDFRDYLKYCSVEKDVPFNIAKIDRYISVAKKKHQVRPLKQKQRWELWLSTDELNYIVNLDHYEPHYWQTLSNNQKRFLDILIFMCLQGMAPVDAQGICKYDVEDHRIVKDRSKCFTEFDVNLDPISEEILIRHDYDLTFTEQTMNDELKRLFVTIFEFYRNFYEQRTGRPYKIICTQKYYKGDELIVKIAHRGLFAENMMGRRTYINIRRQQVGIEGVMPEVGQTKTTTTKGYLYDSQQIEEQQSTLGVLKTQKREQRKIA